MSDDDDDEVRCGLSVSLLTCVDVSQLFRRCLTCAVDVCMSWQISEIKNVFYCCSRLAMEEKIESSIDVD
jgi:hypothetical protein